MVWTATKGGLLGALVGAMAGVGIAVASTKEGEHLLPAVLAGVGGGVALGLGGAVLGQKAHLSEWKAAAALCPADPTQQLQPTPDWVTLQCVTACPDGTTPNNGACPGVNPYGMNALGM
jgi:hypothetical protein